MDQRSEGKDDLQMTSPFAGGEFETLHFKFIYIKDNYKYININKYKSCLEIIQFVSFIKYYNKCVLVY